MMRILQFMNLHVCIEQINQIRLHAQVQKYDLLTIE